jgi:hypothetical protein
MASATDIRNAAMEGNLEVDLQFRCWSLLIVVQLVKKLIAEGADVNARMNTGNLNTPLHNAASRLLSASSQQLNSLEVMIKWFPFS